VGDVGWIAKHKNQMFMCIEKEGNDIVRVVAIDNKQSIFTRFKLVLHLFIKYLDPLSTNLIVSPSLLLISNAERKYE